MDAARGTGGEVYSGCDTITPTSNDASRTQRFYLPRPVGVTGMDPSVRLGANAGTAVWNWWDKIWAESGYQMRIELLRDGAWQLVDYPFHADDVVSGRPTNARGLSHSFSTTASSRAGTYRSCIQPRNEVYGLQPEECSAGIFLDVDFDGDGIFNASDSDDDNDGIPDSSDLDDDNDGVYDDAEAACNGATASLLRPERLDGPFAGTDDDGDTAVDEHFLPAGSEAYDCDGDGYIGSREAQIYSTGTSTIHDQDPCGTSGWPSDLFAGTSFQPNTLNIQDLGSFVTPVRRFQTSQGDANFDPRWDLVAGSSIGEHINIADIAATITSTAGYPPMFNGLRAFGKACPWPASEGAGQAAP